MAITRAQFTLLYEPKLRKVSFEEYKNKPTMHDQVFTMGTSEKQTETDYDIIGLGSWNQKAEGAPVTFENLKPGNAKYYTHVAWEKGSAITREALDDELYGQFKKMAKELGRTARLTVEQEAVKLFNDGFSTDATRNYDSVALFSASHPNYGTVGGVQSNTGSNAALADASLKAAVTAQRKLTNENGQLIDIDPDQLIVPTDLDFTAHEITMSALKTGTGDNDINTLKGRVKVIVWAYLSSTTAWFLRDSSVAENLFFWRVKPEFASNTDFATGDFQYKGYCRFSWGYSNWRGLYGNQGA